MDKNWNSGAVTAAAAGPDTVRDTVETALRAVLGVDEVAHDAQFGALGGDSMRAVRVLSRLWRELGVELSVESLRQDTTVAQFVADVREHAQARPA